MIYKFVKGNFYNMYLNMGVRKTQQTLSLFKDSLTRLLETNWSIPSRGIWISLVKEQLYKDDIDEAIKMLAVSRRGALSVSLRDESTDDIVFIRWYNSVPQTDLLSLESSITIRDNKVVNATSFNRVEELEIVFQEYMIDKLDPKEIRPLGEIFLKSQKIIKLIPEKMDKI